MEDFEVVVIGAGVAGAGAAWQLAKERRVLLLEQESHPGYHTTGRSVAVLSETYGSPAVRALTAASRAFLAAPPPGFADHPLLAPRGLMFVAGPGQEALLEPHAVKAAAAGVAVERCDRAAVCEALPPFRADRVAAGLLEPGACDIDVAALHQGYLRGARAAGAVIRTDAPVAALDRDGGRWRVTAGGETVEAAVVVNAAGAWADALAALAGLAPLGLAPLARTAVTFDADQPVGPWPMAMAADHGFYFKPDAGRILASPSDERPAPPGDVQPEELAVAELMDRLAAATRFAPRRLAARWAGLRTFAPDRDLVCGFDARASGFFWLAGQGGFGIQTAPAAAALVGHLLLGQAAPAGIDPAALSPDRFDRPS